MNYIFAVVHVFVKIFRFVVFTVWMFIQVYLHVKAFYK